MFFKFISIIAAILTTVSFVPQAVKTIKTKDTAGISFVMYLLFTIGVFFWLIYGIYIKDIAIIAANAVTFILAFIILKYKFDNVRKFNES
ncbi:SemiSWEET transporter [Clostridium sp. YIM B02505]|uniref:SemiSWEET transporter n=1 Tax=Clostridium yunnanense TaxID=2800325 RepID=A0ABS1EKJ2_9CLOT|nr:SemiSWEET transporter [Clostridium yunnanense]MBK1809874.1 SemiSWEET transporter [Clostridium yunnanense]